MSTAATAEVHSALPAADQREPALPFRGDTFLGVCEATGEDLGFHPNWLRVPFAALILWNPAVIAAAYLSLGCVVAAARWLYPAQPRQSAQPPAVASANDAAVTAENRQTKELLAA